MSKFSNVFDQILQIFSSEIHDVNGSVTRGDANTFASEFDGYGSQPGGFIPPFDTACASIKAGAWAGVVRWVFSWADENENPVTVDGEVMMREGGGEHS